MTPRETEYIVAQQIQNSKEYLAHKNDADRYMQGMLDKIYQTADENRLDRSTLSDFSLEEDNSNYFLRFKGLRDT